MAILRELGGRFGSEADAKTFVASALVQTELVGELLDSPFPTLREWMCWTLTVVADHESAVVSLLDTHIFEQLVLLLRYG